MLCTSRGSRTARGSRTSSGSRDLDTINYCWLEPIPRMNVGASVTILDGLPKSAKHKKKAVGEKRKRRDAAD